LHGPKFNFPKLTLHGARDSQRDRERSLQNVGVTLRRKSAIVAAVSVDL
jgi:hypothetical protein